MCSSPQMQTSGQVNSQESSASWCPLLRLWGVRRWKCWGPCSAGAQCAEMRCELRQTLWTWKDCSLTWMLLQVGGYNSHLLSVPKLQSLPVPGDWCLGKEARPAFCLTGSVPQVLPTLLAAAGAQPQGSTVSILFWPPLLTCPWQVV